MKRKFLLLATFAIVSSLLTGCSTTDKKHAACTVATSNGNVGSFVTFNGAGYTDSGEARAAMFPIQVEITEDETVTVNFHCSQCGMHENFDFDTTGSHIIYCECPTEDERENSSGPAREYACILICSPQDTTATK